jgi:ligand-binding SRPBCC domain-containing protein
MRTGHRLRCTQHVPRPIEDVFRFFSDAGNLEAITPPFLRFRILTPPPIVVQAGTQIAYRLSLFGVPFGWLTRVETFEPNAWFSDVQLRGPYRRWHHLHEFVARPDGTEIVDTIDYELPLGALGGLAHRLFVQRTLDRIFAHRRLRIAEMLGPDRPGDDARRI